MKSKTVLLVNPWIYDFAAYDFWIKPWGLLKISSILKSAGFKVFLTDCLYRQHPNLLTNTKSAKNGTGKFIMENIQKPLALKGIPRKYKRYGLPVDIAESSMPNEKIDFIMVSSGMTYWYPSVIDIIKILRKKFDSVPIILGGTYATLCYEHAVKYSGADIVIKSKELFKLNTFLGEDLDFSWENILNTSIDYSSYSNSPYGILRISLGCPFSCAYCAQNLLSPSFMLKDMGKALDELKMLISMGIKIFAFYDDALLYAQEYIKKYFNEIYKLGDGLSFYTPNGLHARFISFEIAVLMKKINLVNPIISLETIDPRNEKKWHSKITKNDFLNAVKNLKSAGYKTGEYSAYILLGAPDADEKGVKETIDFARGEGAKILLSEYSVVPGTPIASFDAGFNEEPLYHNNSVYPSFKISEWHKIQSIKNYAKLLE
ncbi:radical SAM domain-containing protein [Candidatus Omnitrophus magneticus]|uniref:Radical SAM domain-containing protein n=1 Tax=Candidatus Omnitrophus magneticus TaxID=1609969 RepID=A0A0F0CUG2_9BACT|nr:radical SAM domain-containing protein [Candidatus Omnitrophus magneticus]